MCPSGAGSKHRGRVVLLVILKGEEEGVGVGVY